MGEKVHTGSVVSILYKGGAKGEEALDDRSAGEPLRVMIGDMKLPRGIEEALIGMEVGQEKQQWYPKQMIDQGYSLKVGDVMFHANPDDGTKQPAFVTDMTADNVKIDLNHPFAGKTLDYWIKLVDIH